ncbi:FixH family protein [Novosphingobium flavum]|uniref:FixH family protein n=1 Tax=Novosphingobium flavum TaxID=1778672 RepID=A0A7X1KLT2_9SPHN|nr:FixH family protein [Novosphingobium flavum]MBC2665638.1 FixH family protein [Novosphingobium flavum]
MTISAARPFTGRHMALIMVGFFAVVITVNLFMARLAGSSFTGIVVENSYVASQNYNRWLAEAKAEEKLGWQAVATRTGDDHVVITLAGVPAGAEVSADAWHPLGRQRDHLLHFRRQGAGFRSAERLPAGRWNIRIEVKAAARRWRTQEAVS